MRSDTVDTTPTHPRARRRRAPRSSYRRSWSRRALCGVLAFVLGHAFTTGAGAFDFDAADLVYRETFLGEIVFPLTPSVDAIGGGGMIAAGSEVAGAATGEVLLTGIEARASIVADGDSFAEVSMNAANIGVQDVGLRIDFDDPSLAFSGPATLRAESELQFLDPGTLARTGVRAVVSIEDASSAALFLEASSDDGSIELFEPVFLTSAESSAIASGAPFRLAAFVDRASDVARVSIEIDGFSLVVSPDVPIALSNAIVVRGVGRGAVVPFATGDSASLDLSLFEVYQPSVAPDDPERPPQTIQFMSDGTLRVNQEPVTELNGSTFTAVVLPDATEFRFAGDLTLFPTDTIVGRDPLFNLTTTTPIRVFAGNDLTMLDGARVDFSAVDSPFGSGAPGPGGGVGGSRVFGGSVSVAGGGGDNGSGGTGSFGPAGGVGADINFSPGGHCVITQFAQGGADGPPGSEGQDGNWGASGSAGGQGADGTNAAGSGGSGGSGGAGGTQGVRGSGGAGASGGAAGASGPPGTAGPGGQGAAGTDGTDAGDGGDGHPGARGDDGSNPATGLVLSAGGGGGGGGQGGGGGAGGGGGGGGAGSGGGGGGAIQSSLLCAAGGDGGRGGNGGVGAPGRDGIAPGASGSGGSGGGAIELRARGRLVVAGLFDVEGEPGEPGDPAGLFPELCPSEFGTFPCRYGRTQGGSGNSGVAGSTTGGDGFAGGRGGDGGAAGARGASGDGGAGAGGTVLLYGSIVDQSDAVVVFAANGDGVESGRYVVASNTTSAGLGTVSGASVESLLGMAVTNPFIDASVATPLIAGLEGGAEGFGLLRGISSLSPDFDAIRSTAPPDATGAVVRMPIGPAGYDDDYLGYDMLVFLSLGPVLASPGLGVNLDGLEPLTSAGLLVGGFANDPAFGGSGPQPLDEIAPYQAYATLIPEATTPFVQATAIGSTGAGSLGVNDVVYLPEASGALRVALLFAVLCAGGGRFDGRLRPCSAVLWKRFGRR